MTGQSYNETRCIDVTVLKSVHVTAMSLDSFCSGINNAFVGARVYDGSTYSLLYSYDSIVSPVCYNSTITLPISYTLNMGQSYRIGFYCFGYGGASATAYVPTFPYLENNGYLKINQAYSYYQDSFPIYSNLFVPLISLMFDTANILPLKLLSFNAKQQTPNSVALNWHTANEVNVSHFTIQRSNNDKDFITIGKVNASCCSYEFTDDIRNLELGIGNLYYRIESIDNDGRKNYSETKSLNIQHSSSNIIIYPNPAKDQVTIECSGAKELLIIDYLGKEVYRKKIINNQESIINVQRFSKGIYVVKAIMNNGDTKTEKLVLE
jgi:hypothetical protein